MSVLDRSGWTAYATTSIDSDHLPAKALDGDNATYWRSQSSFFGGGGTMPQSFWVDMGSNQLFNYITYVPYDWPGLVEIFVSSDGVNWGNPVATVQWPYADGTRITAFPLQNARWIKVYMHDSVQGGFGPVGQCGCYEFNAGLDGAIVGTLSLLASAPPEGTVGEAYNYGIRISQGVMPYTVSVLSGALPAGLTIDNLGLISGIPTAGGAFSATIRVTDDDGTSIDLAISIYIFRPGAPAEGATITKIRLIAWLEFTQSDTYAATGAFYWAEDYSALGDSGFPGLFYTFLDPPVHRATFSGGAKQGVVSLDFVLPVTDFTKVGTWYGIEGTLGGGGLTVIKFYGCYLQADYSDGTRMYSHPGRQQTFNGSGSVTNGALAIDGSLDTFATLTRSSFSGLGEPPMIRLDQFGVFTEIPVIVSSGAFRNWAL